jgi:arginyl-tRNA synthetase
MISQAFNINHFVTQAAQTAVEKLFGTAVSGELIQLQKTRKEFEGNITLVVFPLVKTSKKSPEETGNLLGQYLMDNVPEISAFNVVKGFLNLSLSNSFWLSFFSNALTESHFGFGVPDSKPRIMVEFASPNTNKPLHLGHCRNIFLGDSVSAIKKAAGHKVTRVQIINDRGIHICKSMVAWKQFGNGETPESAGVKGDKLVGKYYVIFDQEMKKQASELVAKGIPEEEAKNQTAIMQEAQEMLRNWEARNEEVIALWKTMNGWVYKGFDVTYHKMGVSFDKLYYESDTYLLGKKEVEDGLKSGAFFSKEDGSIWVDLTGDGLDQKALLRKDGTAMYITQDIGTAILRFKDYPDTVSQVYTVGNEQEYHFKVLFTILKKLGFAQGENCYHLSYGMVELPEGKMKSREGTVVDADDLMDEMTNVAREVSMEQGKMEGLPEEEKEELYHKIGMGALKYFLLKVDPRKNMVFNPKESIDFNGHTGPFIQYTYVRTQAVMRKSNIQETVLQEMGAAFSNLRDLVSKAELDLMVRVYEWPEVLEESAMTYNPMLISQYAYDLARDYNTFYQHSPILREENADLRSFRLAITHKTGLMIRQTMELLGVAMPDRM